MTIATATLAERKLAWIKEQAEAGLTVYLTTYTTAMKITAKTLVKFEAAGKPLFKVVGDVLYVYESKRTGYVNANYSGLVAQEE